MKKILFSFVLALLALSAILVGCSTAPDLAKLEEVTLTEQMRVEKGVAAFRAGDIEAFGALCTESGNSSIVNWEAGSDELKLLYRTLVETDGVYGGRFSGAGFKGCCMALVDPAKEDAIRAAVSEKYKAAFPSLADKFSIHFCDTASGVSFKEGV